ncbi:MAG: hypothetical protein CMF50_05780 [Legionellales bacterium]|nr:hypothetical protein [Legionellales bacterium]|tara:strand:- start:31824 stop:33833 length:2010 start_codon:yes stop_codon:yes gene_type:complete
MIDYLQPLFTWLHQNPGWAGIITFLIAFGESLAIVGLIVPGSVMLTAIGALVGADIIPMKPIFIWAILGAIAGDGVSYHLGRHFKDHINDFWPFRRHPQLIKKGQAFFEKHGGKSVFLGRFVGPIRPIIPMVAGMMDMAPRWFILSNVSSGILWAPAYMIPGIIIGAASSQLAPHATTRLIGLLFVALILIWILYLLIKITWRWFYRGWSWLMQHVWDFCGRHKPTRFIHILLQNPQQPGQHGQLSLGIVFLLLGFSFITVACSVLNQGILTHFNSGLAYFAKTIYHPQVASVMASISLFGWKYSLLTVALIIFAYLCFIRQWRTALHWIGAIGITLVVALAMKHLIHSPRPGSMGNDSFPSGHATFSVIFYGLWGVLVCQHLSRQWHRFITAVICLICLAIFVSRIYLSYHWLTDIAAGLLLASSVLSLATISYRRYPTPKLANFRFITISIVSLLVVVGLDGIHESHKDYNYAPKWPQTTTSTQQWWQGQQGVLAYGQNWFGKPVALMNAQWQVPLPIIAKHLTRQGWLEEPQPTAITFINRITDANKMQRISIITPRFLGKKPIAIFTKPATDKNYVLVLNVWQANTKLRDSKTPLLYSTIGYHKVGPHKYLPHHHQQPANAESAVDILRDELDGFALRKVTLPLLQKPRSIKTSQWEQGVLLVRE